MHSTRPNTSIAVFGLHVWGKHVVRICQELGVTVHGIDPDPVMRRTIAKQYPNVLLYKDSGAILKNQSIPSCIITAPSSLHYTLARQSLLSGKHVLVEKPMTQNLQEARNLVALAKKHRLRLMTDHTYLFSPALNKAKDVISSGRIGHLRHIRSERSGPGPIRPDSSVLWDLAPHDISVAWLLTGQYPTRARLLNSFPDTPSGPYDADIELTYPSNITFHGHISWMLPQKTRTLTVIGTKAALTIEWDGIQEILRYYPVSGKRASRFYYQTSIPIRIRQNKEPLLQSVEYFLSSARKHPTTLTDGTHALAVIRIINALHHQGITASTIKDRG